MPIFSGTGMPDEGIPPTSFFGKRPAAKPAAALL
jgi:hypothetical protein